jgi:hypothetical protein
MKVITIESVKKKLIKNLKASGLVILPVPLVTDHFLDNQVISLIIELDKIADKLVQENIKYVNILSIETITEPIAMTDKFIIRCKLYIND